MCLAGRGPLQGLPPPTIDWSLGIRGLRTVLLAPGLLLARFLAFMSPTTLGESSLWDVMDFRGGLEPLEGFLNPSSCRQSYTGSLLLGQDLDLLSTDAPWLISDLATGTEQKLVVDDLFQPCSFPAAAAGVAPAALHPGQPLVPALGSDAFAAAPLSSTDLSLAGSDTGSLGSGAGAPAIISPVLSMAQHAATPSFQQQEQPQPPAGALPQQPPKAKGRPRVDRSQMTRKQLKAIEYARAHSQRKRTNMRDLEERVADVRADLERERAQQEDSQRSIEVLEQLLSYKDEMVAALREHDQEARTVGAPSDANPAAHPSRHNHTGSLAAARPPLAALPVAAGNSEPMQPGQQLDRGKGTAAATAGSSTGCSLCSRLGRTSIYNYTCSCGRRLGPGPLPGPSALSSLPDASWTHKLPATWAFVEDVRIVQLPKLLLAEGKVSVCLSANYQVEAAIEQPHEGLEHIPGSYWEYLTMNGLDDLSAICAAASPAVVNEVLSMRSDDMVEAWRDYALVAREVVAEHEVTKNEAMALARLNPSMERLTILINLAIVHNPVLLKHLYLASGDNLSEQQRRDKYDSIVAAMEFTPSQQERYLEVASSYDRFVQQARQHKAEALARVGKSAFSSLSGSASLRQMVSGYLDALEGAHMLSHYPDAEFIAVMELMKGTAKIYKPLQKAKGAAAAYPQFMDILHLVEAIKRLPPPEQRRRLTGEA